MMECARRKGQQRFRSHFHQYLSDALQIKFKWDAACSTPNVPGLVDVRRLK
jgi:hypothetical protein